jgi:hypothetical protein
MTSYTVLVQRKYFPFLGKKYKCYRHEVVLETKHLILYRVDRTQIAIPINKRSWILQADYWDFMAKLNAPHPLEEKEPEEKQ